MSRETLRSAIVRQFGRPTGVLGQLAGQIMAHRPSNKRRNRRTVELLGLQPADRVLEIGFGPGLAIAEAIPRLPEGHFVGLDHSVEMLRQAAERNAAALQGSRLTLCLGTLATCGLEPGSFDKVFAVNVHLFWREPEAELRRVAKLMKPGGTIAITHQPRHRGATDTDAEVQAAEIGRQLLVTGFTDVRREVLSMKPVNAVCVLAKRNLAPGA